MSDIEFLQSQQDEVRDEIINSGLLKVFFGGLAYVDGETLRKNFKKYVVYSYNRLLDAKRLLEIDPDSKFYSGVTVFDDKGSTFELCEHNNGEILKFAPLLTRYMELQFSIDILTAQNNNISF